MGDSAGEDGVEMVREIARQLHDLGDRLASASSTDVQLSLLERATELSEKAARTLEQTGRET